MKRWLVILIIAVILGGFVVFVEIYVNDTLSQLILSINNIVNTVKTEENINFDETLKLANDMKDYWEKREKIICLSYNHKDLEKIGEGIVKVNTYAHQNDKQNFEYELNVLLFYVEGYKDVITTNFQNVL